MSSETIRKFHELLHKELVYAEKVPCCLTCKYFVKDKPECGNFRVVPPPDIIVFGCGKWDNDKIPF